MRRFVTGVLLVAALLFLSGPVCANTGCPGGGTSVGTATAPVPPKPPAPTYKELQEKYRKACLANLKVLLGAVEMYNMDHKVMITKLSSKVLNNLKKLGYLKALPKCAKKGNYLSKGDLTKKGKCVCSFHGDALKLPKTIKLD